MTPVHHHCRDIEQEAFPHPTPPLTPTPPPQPPHQYHHHQSFTNNVYCMFRLVYAVFQLPVHQAAMGFR